MSVVTVGAGGSKDYPTILRENMGLGGIEQKTLREYLRNYPAVADEVMDRGEPYPAEPTNVVLNHILQEMEQTPGYFVPQDLRNAAIAYNNRHARLFAPYDMRSYY
jgi:hypothetical protein